ncbi:3-oxoacyl-acyl-carrier-protein synthase [Colletotrichum incanum]|uniref:3-oxoacyl-acyl-carrier-protein synthase n=1 Tax=Colletotrichum incanum TaxID=1573173 RepID=A0A161WIM3_COLIC|nr:3-oxoacyl-acyl-carrier-protein synthase [Colletotrichum incanum]OHW89511.1 3-oxoacyl-acyl-carrier-protein synthase [Colletotrichum incanum]
MSFTLYDASIPILLSGLQSLLNIVAKLELFASENRVTEKEILGWRLVEDMLPLEFQLRIVTDSAMKVAGCGLRERPEPVANIALESLCDAREQLQHAASHLRAADRDEFSHSTDRIVSLGLGPGRGKIQVTAREYIFAWGIPTFFFHLQTTYCISRARGVILGKRDYISPFMTPVLDEYQEESKDFAPRYADDKGEQEPTA